MDTKISIVIPVLLSTNEQLAMTIKCIELAKENTTLDYETIIVETGTDYLKDYADFHIYEKEKTTCTKSINRGFKIANGDYIVLLTNDVMVNYNWLECLLECFIEKKDCGLSTLATYQLNHIHKNEILEGIWFSVAMIPKEMALFDEYYVNSWDDSDLIMRTYLSGKKMYRNHKCLVQHWVGKTEYSKPDHMDNYKNNEKYFRNKFSEHKNHKMFKILTEGTIV